MTPDFQILADRQDVTQAIRTRFISLTITDEAGWQSDNLEIKIDDRGSAVEMPRHGTQLDVRLGYKESGLVRMGIYTVDEVSLEGSPDTMIIRARAANFRKSFKEQKTRAWENISLDALVKTIAKEHELEPVVSETLAAKVINHIDQTDESDLHFLTRIAKEHGAISKPVDNRLIFVPRGEARTATSKPMPVFTLSKPDLSRYSFSFADRGKYEAVIAHWHNSNTGQQVPVKVGNQDARPIFTLKGLHPDANAAEAAARAKLQALQRGQATGNLTLPGRTGITAEAKVKLKGIKDKVNGGWVVTRAEHSLSSSGLTTRLNIETPNL
ncbi:contractile injection system protein, VgrG/Pvc8 family [Endozoicomonas gorgoniicola]|uniref:Contractile injection system protein, VgrG/Pvc8 family n=1 Tax=Endozoicomonas gorgoniicola TaxID=1234144 RepID=A0ABT3MTA1_9GAMM|nr:contractile injection system protein, VgrG/Pvc8 family [Endozoicomonas gorgoniicola]MCW7552607.1 contractile injection system protein, VgrG/Pvc8 family [Endozoicomonas gorgoniicola]